MQYINLIIFNQCNNNKTGNAGHL